MSNRNRILMRYSVISLGFLIFAAIIVLRLINTTVVRASEWNERAEEMLSGTTPIAPERGNILADNGSILACNLLAYDVKIDLRHAKILQLDKKLPWKDIDALADSLDKHYPLKADLKTIPAKDSEDSWHTKFRKEFAKKKDDRTRALRIVKKGTLEDFEKIKSFPFLKDFKGNGAKNPTYVESKTVRIYPFGKMAYRSIGRVNEFNGQIRGYSGLEKDLDSLLFGKEGKAKKVMMTSGVGNWVDTPAERGFDVQTTINIDIQDMLEEELTNICMKTNAVWGTALIMEVETGELKAIANVEKLDDGSYGEALNRAVLGFEPGSVMKPISLMVAFEDGLVKSVNDVVDCSTFQMTSDPHAPRTKNMKQVIEMSSNTGISRVIFRGYSKEPQKFKERLASIGFFDPMKSGISDEETPRFPDLGPTDRKGNTQTMVARHLSLARQSFGYAATIPPIYTLAYYNAIANGGVLVKPHLVKRISNEVIDSVIDVSKLSRRICSEENAEKVKMCLKEPVWGSHGTARGLQDDRVVIAGKTGTAFPVFEKGGGYDKSKRRFAFCGFFPYDNPKYTCMALILAPAGSGGAGTTSGMVLKNMALKMFSRGLLDNNATFTAEQSQTEPIFTTSEQNNSHVIASHLGVKKRKAFKDNRNDSEKGSVPDLAGYDAKAAIRILESMGWNVKINGAGYVTSQMPAAGTPLKRGSTIKLGLSI